MAMLSIPILFIWILYTAHNMNIPSHASELRFGYVLTGGSSDKEKGEKGTLINITQALAFFLLSLSWLSCFFCVFFSLPVYTCYPYPLLFTVFYLIMPHHRLVELIFFYFV